MLCGYHTTRFLDITIVEWPLKLVHSRHQFQLYQNIIFTNQSIWTIVSKWSAKLNILRYISSCTRTWILFLINKHCSELTGIGKTLDPDFSFAKIAAPYAQVSTSFYVSFGRRLSQTRTAPFIFGLVNCFNSNMTIDGESQTFSFCCVCYQELLDTRNGQQTGSQYFVQQLQRQANDVSSWTA